MNSISIQTYYNTFSQNNYYGILIDGISLEEHALNQSHIDITSGLVSTFLNWLSDPLQRKIVWERALPEGYTKVYLPILMCGTDIDLWSTVIIAEVEADDHHVYWNKLGLDDSDFEYSPEPIGTTVNWFSGNTLVFKRTEYETVLNTFKKYLDGNFTGKVYDENLN
ncbi:hypothetical protein [Kordia sp.]|uniref:hypothetical protein n=1 Tax=Kordia sp. TaxID=1965332 RepID=UPI0025BDACDA|nr:hypothetical protein [Kordia sp.]MCH2192823.1 hypothetical protein [Kordia sp.]